MHAPYLLTNTLDTQVSSVKDYSVFTHNLGVNIVLRLTVNIRR